MIRKKYIMRKIVLKAKEAQVFFSGCRCFSRKGRLLLFKKALPLTIITGIIFLIGLAILTNYYVLNDAILKVIFIGLASLTFPHILLEYLLEKNEKRT